jgi:hypothetical protein
MGVTAVLTAHAKPGRHNELRQGLEEMKKIIEKQGLDCRIVRPVTGEHQGNLSLVTQYDSWGAFATAAEKIQGSSEYRKLSERGVQNPDPAVQSMDTQLLVDVE